MSGWVWRRGFSEQSFTKRHLCRMEESSWRDGLRGNFNFIYFLTSSVGLWIKHLDVFLDIEPEALNPGHDGLWNHRTGKI